MKKLLLGGLVSLMVIGLYSTAISAACSITMYDSIAGETYTGATDETTKTQQATYDAYMIFKTNYGPFGGGGDDCFSDYGVSLPSWNGSCYTGCMGTPVVADVPLSFCQDGSWTVTSGSTVYENTWNVVCDETLITLSSFTATPKAGQVILKWSTASEIDNAGFNLYRAESENGDYIKINNSLIPAQGAPAEGASYEYADSNVKNRRIYYYKLEDVDLTGVATFNGPVSATPRLINVIRKK